MCAMSAMNWGHLLSESRYVPDTLPAPPKVEQATEHQEDARRLIYSSPFRRLQGKAQVHPLPAYDYLRTRLTHSIEVAHVGRLIARRVGEVLSNRDIPGINIQAMSDVVYAACLAHDVGNPPFGHVGEYAIQTWFQRMNDRHSIVRDVLSEDKWKNDFLLFDGNAQGFRVLTRLADRRMTGGLRLTYAVLGAFSKYPYSSQHASPDHPKFGFMYHDRTAAQQIFQQGLQLIGDKNKLCRHPLAFLVEAADDICYLTTDLEDAVRTKIIPFHQAEVELKNIAEAGSQIVGYSEFSADSDPQDRIAFLRAAAVASLVNEAVHCFGEHYDQIISGRADGFSLMESCKYRSNVERIRQQCRENIYIEGNKLQLEAAGYNMIMELMDLFGGMILQILEKKSTDNLDRRSQGLYHLLPKEFRSRISPNDPYASLLVAVDYISGMTDRFTLDLHQKITGSSTTIGRML